MSAEVLRSAAALMRERAQAATRRHMPWDADDEEVWTQDNDGQPVFIGGRMSPADATHIASFANPAVALAVADWLEDVAATHDDPYYRENYDDLMRPALAVANAYLATPPH